MNELVKRLAEGDHAVELGLRPEKSVVVFRECVDRGYIYVKFTGTRGGTELGIRLDKQETKLEGADIETQSGTVRLVGRLKLNYVPVKCIADIDLATWEGTGHLEVLKEEEVSEPVVA
jgi:hypothetical protein